MFGVPGYMFIGFTSRPSSMHSGKKNCSFAYKSAIYVYELCKLCQCGAKYFLSSRRCVKLYFSVKLITC